jgi:hypothetical protein
VRILLWSLLALAVLALWSVVTTLRLLLLYVIGDEVSTEPDR